MRKIILMGLLLLAPLMAEKFDPATYEANLIANDKAFQSNVQSTLDKCKAYAKKARAYRAYLDASGRDDEYTRATVEICQARIRTFCGAISSAQKVQ